jgi:hypothetical protein
MISLAELEKQHASKRYYSNLLLHLDSIRAQRAALDTAVDPCEIRSLDEILRFLERETARLKATIQEKHANLLLHLDSMRAQRAALDATAEPRETKSLDKVLKFLEQEIRGLETVLHSPHN